MNIEFGTNTFIIRRHVPEVKIEVELLSFKALLGTT